MRKVLIVVPIALLIAAGCNTKSTEPAPQQSTQTQGSPPSSATTATAPANTAAITLDAATKVAVVQAVRNGFDILASKDAVKIRNYYLTVLQDSDQKAQFAAMSDSQILQVAAAAVANAGKPLLDLATDPAATWKLDGNTVIIATKSNAAPNPAYPAISDLNVTYQAVYINGVWY